MDESGLDMSHTWTHSPCGLLCLIPSLSVMGSGSVPRTACVGVLLLFVVERRSQGCVLDVCVATHRWTDIWVVSLQLP